MIERRVLKATKAGHLLSLALLPETDVAGKHLIAGLSHPNYVLLAFNEVLTFIPGYGIVKRLRDGCSSIRDCAFGKNYCRNREGEGIA